MVADPDALKTYAKKVFDAASSGSFDIRLTSAEFASDFRETYHRDTFYWEMLKGWHDCMRQKYNESIRETEKLNAMRGCLSQSKSSGNPTVEGAWAIQHLEELIDDFANKSWGEIQSFSRP